MNKVTREAYCKTVCIRADVAQALLKEYNIPFEQAIKEVVFERMCVRIVNTCCKCRRKIFVWVLKSDWKSQERFRNTKEGECAICNPNTRWDRI